LASYATEDTGGKAGGMELKRGVSERCFMKRLECARLFLHRAMGLDFPLPSSRALDARGLFLCLMLLVAFSIQFQVSVVSSNNFFYAPCWSSELIMPKDSSSAAHEMQLSKALEKLSFLHPDAVLSTISPQNIKQQECEAFVHAHYDSFLLQLEFLIFSTSAFSSSPRS
jgi:hypothetical protein